MTTTYYLAALLIIGLPLAYFAGKRMGDALVGECIRQAAFERGRAQGKLEATQEQAAKQAYEGQMLADIKAVSKGEDPRHLRSVS